MVFLCFQDGNRARNNVTWHTLFFSPWTSPALHSKDYHHHEKIESEMEKTKFACANRLGVFQQGGRLMFTNLYWSSIYRWIFSVFKREIEWGTTQVHCKSYHRYLRLAHFPSKLIRTLTFLSRAHAPNATRWQCAKRIVTWYTLFFRLGPHQLCTVRVITVMKKPHPELKKQNSHARTG